MIYEYALEPSLVVDWALAGIGRFVGQFGMDHRRLISDFPKDWKGHVYEDFLARFDYDNGHPDFVNAQPILDAYLQILTNYIVARKIRVPDGTSWLDETIQEHDARPFHAIFAAQQTSTSPPDVITQQNIDDVWDARWWLPTIKTTKKSAKEIALVLRPLLRIATEIYIVDPYFDPSAKRFQDTFAEIIRQAATMPRSISSNPVITLMTSVERAFKHGEKPTNDIEHEKRLVEERNVAAYILEFAKRHLPKLVPPDITVRVVILKNALGGDPLHNRFVLTDMGAVIVPYGLDDYDCNEDHSAMDDLTLMPLGMYEERWNQYTQSKGITVVLGPETICGDVP